MEAFLTYLLKSAALLALFVPLFKVLMQNETFHRLNRFSLLGIIALSLALPLVNIGIETPFNRLLINEQQEPGISTIEIIEIGTATPAMPQTAVETSDIIAAVYIAAALLMLARFITMYASLARIIKRSKIIDSAPHTTQRITLHVTDDEKIKPFSWFGHVVINKSDLCDGGPEIITHEAAHARALHSLDILLLELLIIIQWFNPAAWMAKKCIMSIHEFEADDAVIASGTSIETYRELIIKKAVGARLYSIANSFNHSSTIKRITMMCKKKSNLWRCSKLLCTLPVAAIATLLFSQPESINATEQPSDGKVTEFVAYEQETRPTIAPTPEKRVATAVGDVSKATPNDTVPNKERVYQVVEQMPQFPGGQAAMMKFLQENINYPADARNANAEGRAFVNFIVSDKGEILNITIVKSTGNAALDKEAVRVVSSMPAWAPGKQGGKAVYTQLTLPVAFKLSNPKKVSEALFLPREEKNGSTTEANSPLLVINGAIYEGNADILNNFKEEDIESINVLQEESAVKTYGEKAKHGAIIIELKKRASSTPIIPEKQAPQADEKSIYKFNSNTGRNKIELTNATYMPDGAMSKTLQITKSDAADYDKAATFTGNLQELKLSNNKMIVESGFTKGRVTMEFNVETDGTLTFAKVKQSSGNNIVDTAALTALLNTQGKWQPATKDGKPVRSRPTLSITFQRMQ